MSKCKQSANLTADKILQQELITTYTRNRNLQKQPEAV